MTEYKTGAIKLEKCPISEMKAAIIKPKLAGISLEKNSGTESNTFPFRIDYSKKPLLSESERNAIKLMIVENQMASNEKLVNKRLKELCGYEKKD